MTDAHVEVEHRFAMIPEGLLYDSAISPHAIRVYGVLLRHGSDPTNCYPTHARIASLIGCSKRSVNAWIVELEAAGWLRRIARQRPDGAPDSNGYRVYAVPAPDAEERGLHADQRGGVRADQRGPSTPRGAPKESNGNESNGNEKPSSAPPASAQLALVDERPVPDRHLAVGQNLGTDRDLAFCEFWASYPLKKGKGQARAAWVKARRKGVLPEVIVSGARRYAADPNRRPKFTRNPATWLNGEGWTDDPEVDRSDQPRQSRDATGMSVLRSVRSGAPALGAGS